MPHTLILALSTHGQCSRLGIERSEFAPWPGTLFCVLEQDTTLTLPLSTQVYKYVPANSMLGVTLRWTSIPSGGGGGVEVQILLVASCHRNRYNLRPDGPLSSY